MSSPLSAALTPGRGGVALRGVVLGYLALLIVLPLSVLVAKGLGQGAAGFWAAVTAPVAADAAG